MPEKKLDKSEYSNMNSPRRNYWVIGKDGVRRGPASLDNDGVRIMKERGAQCIPLKRGEVWTTELRK